MAKGNRGGKRAGGFTRSQKQDRKLQSVANKIRNYKNEQYFVINDDGEIILHKKGGVGEVTHTVGESREFLPGAITLHNHPGDGEFGGTFSDVDWRDFGYGAKEIRVSAPEGDYIITNKMFGTKYQADGWVEMSEGASKIMESRMSSSQIIKQANENLKNSKTAKEIESISKKWVDIRDTQGKEASDKYFNSVESRFNALQAKRKTEIANERKRLGRKVHDDVNDFYKKNAKKNGFEYKFIPKKAVNN